MPRIIVNLADGTAMTVQVAQPETIIGRGAGCDVRLKDESKLSRKHLRIELRDGVMHAHDLGSFNGTRYRGSKIESRMMLEGDVLLIGPVRLVFRYQDAPADGNEDNSGAGENEPGHDTESGEQPAVMTDRAESSASHPRHAPLVVTPAANPKSETVDLPSPHEREAVVTPEFEGTIDLAPEQIARMNDLPRPPADKPKKRPAPTPPVAAAPPVVAAAPPPRRSSSPPPPRKEPVPQSMIDTIVPDDDEEEVAERRRERRKTRRPMVAPPGRKSPPPPSLADTIMPDEDEAADSDVTPVASPSGAAIQALPPPGDDRMIGSDLAGYRLVRCIGRGGMGLVYLAEHPAMGVRAAIKMIGGEADQATRTLFFREARAAFGLVHPNIVRVLHADVAPDGRPYLVMDYVEGPSLKHHTPPGGLPGRTVAQLLIQICAGLKAAHDAGLIHRDIKPDNILLDRSTHRPRITDFGLTREITAGPERGTFGTPVYMAPEQWRRGAILDNRADLYSLGVTAYYLLARRHPYPTKKAREVMRMVIQRQRTPLLDVVPNVDPDLADIVEGMMDWDVATRYQTASDIQADLTDWLAMTNTRQLMPPPPRIG